MQRKIEAELSKNDSPRTWRHKRVGNPPPLSHEIQSGLPGFLNSFWSLGVAGSRLSLRLGQCFMSKGKEYKAYNN